METMAKQEKLELPTVQNSGIPILYDNIDDKDSDGKKPKGNTATTRKSLGTLLRLQRK